jgi:excisionase family DNA binding protein
VTSARGIVGGTLARAEDEARVLTTEFMSLFDDRLVEDLVELVEQRADRVAAERSGERAAVTIGVAAERLGISRAGVERLVASGRLPSLRLGRRRLIAVRAPSQLLADGGDPEPLAELRPRSLRRRR